MLSLARQEPWFASFLLSESRGYRSRGVREIQQGAWQVGILLDRNGNVVTPNTTRDTAAVLMTPFFAEERAEALLCVRDAEVNEGYIQYGILDRNEVREALLENSRIIVRAGPFQAGLEARDIIVRPPVAGYGEVQSTLEYLDRELFPRSGGQMTGPLDLVEIEAGSPRTQAVNRGYVDALVLGITRFIGRLNAAIDEVHYTEPSGIQPSPGPLISAVAAGGGAQIIVEISGVMPPTSVMPDAALSYGDYLLSDGTAWYHFPLQTEAVTGSMVGLVPPVFTRGNVQEALQQTEALMNNKLNKTSDTMTGTLTMDVGFAGLPSIFIRKPTSGGSPTACLQIIGPGASEAIRVDGDVILNDGVLNVMGSGGGGFIMSRQFFLGVDLNCGYMLGPDTGSGGLWRTNLGQMTLRRPPGQDQIYSEDANAVTRYRILDERDISPPLIVEPPQLVIPDVLGQWMTYATFSFPIARGGNSRIKIEASITMDLTQAGALIIGSIRAFQGIAVGNQSQRRLFCYRSTNQGITDTAILYADVTGFSPLVTVELCKIDGAAGTWTAVGGAPDNPARSQLLITDLGPR